MLVFNDLGWEPVSLSPKELRTIRHTMGTIKCGDTTDPCWEPPAALPDLPTSSMHHLQSQACKMCTEMVIWAEAHFLPCLLNFIFVIKKNNLRKEETGEMTQKLHVLTALPVGLRMFPAPTWRPITVCNSSPKGSDTLFWSLSSARHSCGAHTYTEAKTSYT